MNYEELAHRLFDLLTVRSRGRTENPMEYIQNCLNGEYAVLSELSDNGAATPGSLSRSLCRSTARIANTLKSLEFKGLVRRQTDTSDHRRVKVMITDKGKAIALKKKKELCAVVAKLFENMGEQDAIDYLRLQEKAMNAFAIRRAVVEK